MNTVDPDTYPPTAIFAIENADFELQDATVQDMDENGMAEYSANQDQDMECGIII